MSYTWYSFAKGMIPNCSKDILKVLKKCVSKKALWFNPQTEDQSLSDIADELWTLAEFNPDRIISAIEQALRDRKSVKHIFTCLRDQNDDTKDSYAVNNSLTPESQNSDKQNGGSSNGIPRTICTDQSVADEEGSPMAKYRKIDCRTQNDEKFRALSDDGKLIWYTILSHPNLTPLGAMKGSTLTLSSDLKWNPERLSKGFNELLANGMAKYDEDACFIWLPNFLKYNAPENPNVLKSWGGCMDSLPECALKNELAQYVSEYTKGLTQPFRDAFRLLSKAFGEPTPKQEQEQEQEQEQDKTPLTPLLLLQLWNENRGKLPAVEVMTETELKKVRPLVYELNEVARSCNISPIDKWVEIVKTIAATAHPTNYYFLLPSFFAKDSSKLNKALSGTYSREFGKNYGDQAAELRRKQNRGSHEGRATTDGESANGKPSLTGIFQPKMRNM